MHNLNYTPTTLGVQSCREIISGGTQTKKVEYHCSGVWVLLYSICTDASSHYSDCWITCIIGIWMPPLCMHSSLFRSLITEWFIMNITGIWVFCTIHIFICFQIILLLYYLFQKSQEYGCSPLCTRWWILRLFLLLNDLLHILQEYGCSPLWMRWCIFK
jgi:hypothetical protein